MPTNASKYGFIYSITNKQTGQVYIGSTNRILSSRWLEHKKRLRNGEHVNKELQTDYDNIGLRNFSFRLVEKCIPADTETREQYWLNHYRSLTAGVYNTGEDAGTVFKGRQHSTETKEKIAATLKNTLAERRKTEKGRR